MSGRKLAKARWGSDACGMFRQSGNGRDVIGLDGCVLARQSRRGRVCWEKVRCDEAVKDRFVEVR